MADKVVLQFSTSTSWQSALIRRACHSCFSHVDFVLEDGNMLGASDHEHGPCIAGSPRGVAIRPPDYQEFRIRRQMVIKTVKADDIIDYAMSQLKKPFDQDALYAFASDALPWQARDWRDPDKWFCAELCTAAFEIGGYWHPETLRWPKDRITPADLYLLFMWDPLWVNKSTFWDPIPGLKLGRSEK